MTDKQYIRDERSPKPKNATVSRVMSHNKAANTGPELVLRKLLWAAGLRGYRVNYKSVPGRPDIAFVKYRLAIFVNGCYWHRCPKCDLPIPKTNTAFWKAKFQRNTERDMEKTRQLTGLGWKVITVWECEIPAKTPDLIRRIKARISATAF